jgi:hypothetical protein
MATIAKAVYALVEDAPRLHVLMALGTEQNQAKIAVVLIAGNVQIIIIVYKIVIVKAMYALMRLAYLPHVMTAY